MMRTVDDWAEIFREPWVKAGQQAQQQQRAQTATGAMQEEARRQRAMRARAMGDTIQRQRQYQLDHKMEIPMMMCQDGVIRRA